MAKIWENNLTYDVLRYYVDYCTRASYRRITVEGSVPRDERGILITPNHANTLLDALVVLQLDHRPTAFGARADIFKNPTAAKILHFLRIVPIARKRDGIRSLAQNLEIIPEIYDVMHHGVPFCIFPEGTHRPKYSLLPIRKGAVRLAVGNALEGQTTCIVPVGIEYSDFFHYRGTCKLRVGEPFDVSKYMEEHADLTRADLYGQLSGELINRLSQLFLCLPDDETYEARLAEVRPPRRRRWWQIPLAVLTLPLFVLAAVLTLPMWGLGEYICYNKIKDIAFRNSIRFMAKLLLTPLMFIIWAVLGFIFLPAWLAACLLLYFVFSYSLFYDWLNLVRK